MNEKTNSQNMRALNWRLLIMIILFLDSNAWGQSELLIDEQLLPNRTLIKLSSTGLADENKQYKLEFIYIPSKDTIVQYLDSIVHAYCSPPNSIFFVNDSIGFFTESGGCYASYNWLFRTTDKGVTWKYVESGSRTDGNSFNMLNNESFYMFNELNGIIVWEINDGKLIYSLTMDGGINWTMYTRLIFENNNKKELQDLYFSADGEVTVICSEKFIKESDRKKVTIFQSNNFGKSFHKLK